jgi:hypothetical protein
MQKPARSQRDIRLCPTVTETPQSCFGESVD